MYTKGNCVNRVTIYVHRPEIEKETNGKNLSQMRQSKRDRRDQVGDRPMPNRPGVRHRATNVRLEDKREELRATRE